jgi:hypothetical protein
MVPRPTGFAVAVPAAQLDAVGPQVVLRGVVIVVGHIDGVVVDFAVDHDARELRQYEPLVDVPVVTLQCVGHFRRISRSGSAKHR